MSIPFALQLYTVRVPLAQDTANTMRRVKEAGYTYVELAGLSGKTPMEFKTMLDDAGLLPVSSHFGMEEYSERMDSVLERCSLFGVKHAILSYANAEDRAGWEKTAAQLNQIAEQLGEAGVSFLYHNHAHEFEKQYDGLYALDILLGGAPKVMVQLDTFWVRYGKEDPVAYIRKYTGRCPLLHVKDMAPEGDKPIFAEVGSGTLEWPDIFAAAQQAGVAWYIVEQDECKGDPIESAAVSAKFLAGQ